MRTELFGSGDCLRLRRISAFTIVELLITISIIALLVGLLLPGIQAARESSRRSHCQSNLRQIALSLLLFHDTYNVFPNGGWGHEWVGDPDQGAGSRQPGGWLYDVLPNVEERDLHDLGAMLTGADAVAAYSHRMQSPLPLFVCPSRRPCATWEVAAIYDWVRTPKPWGAVTEVARADYAINAGTSGLLNFPGPKDLRRAMMLNSGIM